MMKRFVLSVTFSLVCALTAHAQDPRFFQSLDFPSDGSSIPQSNLKYIAAGWAFHCDTGEHPVFAVPALLNLDSNTWVPMDGTKWFQKDHLYRPDVYNAYRYLCPKVHEYEGFQLYLTFTPAPGRYRVWVFWNRETISRDITITAG